MNTTAVAAMTTTMGTIAAVAIIMSTSTTVVNTTMNAIAAMTIIMTTPAGMTKNPSCLGPVSSCWA